MSLGVRKKLPLITLSAFFVLVVSLGWWSQRERLQAKTTASRMREVMMLLQSHPGPCDSACLADLAQANDKAQMLKDAWGSELKVEMVATAYKILSFGKDQEEGALLREMGRVSRR